MVPRVLTMFQDEDVTRFLSAHPAGASSRRSTFHGSPAKALELVTSGEQYQALFDDAIKGIERLIAAIKR
jgi:hypothetical protein